VIYTDSVAQADYVCDAHMCGAPIPAGTPHAVRMIAGKASSKRRVCCACACAGRDAEAARPAVVTLPVVVRKAAPRRTYRRSTSLDCSCANCRSGRESLCLRD
jgi:hypothetical protein